MSHWILTFLRADSYCPLARSLPKYLRQLSQTRSGCQPYQQFSSAQLEKRIRRFNNTFPSIRPRNTPSAIGLEIARFSCAADRATPALAKANKGRTWKHTQGWMPGWMPLSSRSAMESVARTSRSNSASVASADDLSLLKI